LRRKYPEFHKNQARLRRAGQIGWTSKKQVGSHRKLQKPGWRNSTFCFPGSEKVGPAALAKIAKDTGLPPEDL
jgi:predicted RNA binding protein YcfA (HicA-like mRNA interferase family)